VCQHYLGFVLDQSKNCFPLKFGIKKKPNMSSLKHAYRKDHMDGETGDVQYSIRPAIDDSFENV